jgi:hypothetical protein
MESYLLRHRMLHFIQNFVYYITFEVISPRNHDFLNELTSFSSLSSSSSDGPAPTAYNSSSGSSSGSVHALPSFSSTAAASGSASFSSQKDINDLMELHEKFLDNCLKDCLLASSDLLKILTKIMTTCLLFADHLIRLFQDIENKFMKKEEFQQQQGGGGRTTKSPAAINKSTSHDFEGKGGGGGKGVEKGGEKGEKDNKGGISKKEIEKLHSNIEKKQYKIMNYAELLFNEIKHESFHRIIGKFSSTFDSQVSFTYSLFLIPLFVFMFTFSLLPLLSLLFSRFFS